MAFSERIKVEIFTNSLCPGMMLENDAFDSDGKKVLDKGKPVTEANIAQLKQVGTKKISYERIRENLKTINDNPAVSKEHYDKALNVLDDIHSGIAQNTSMQLSNYVNELIGDFIDDIENNENRFVDLCDLANLDEYSYTHSINTATLSIMSAISMKWSKKLVNMVGTAGLLMDIGNILIPPEILSKPGELTPEEWKLVKQHPILGYNYLKNEPELDTQILNAVLFHHEWYNGQGYPFGVDNKKTSEISQLVTVADVFDASTTERAHRRATPLPDVYNFILKNAGKIFHPRIARYFLQYVARKLNQQPVFPEDCFVVLNTGEIAVVMGYSRDKFSLRPIVNIFINVNKKDKVLKYEIPVDLEQNMDREIVEIIQDTDYIQKLEHIREKIKLAAQGVYLF